MVAGEEGKSRTSPFSSQAFKALHTKVLTSIVSTEQVVIISPNPLFQGKS
jgi:hypothetical protein